ncbi:pyridoxal 5'-phosphate synthase [Microbacterium sp. X-17]|uniref:pyridoxal 5'-phosphate synthase n=1 Tax=Microbacterium sp. X-17 TaxID=3144404 RepID=UPI0031F4F452
MSDFLLGASGMPPLPAASEATRDPGDLLRAWVAEAERSGVREALAATLATASPEGIPSSRTLRLAALSADGVVFGTSAASRKGRDLAANPVASVTVYWRELALQLRLDGGVEVLEADASDALFADRPPAARAATVVSEQDAALDDLAVLRARAESLAAAGAPIARPADWWGYRLVPSSIEFWQGSPDRLHRRLRYERADGGAWSVRGLQP